MNTPKDELTALLALSGIENLKISEARFLYNQVGNAKDIFRNHKDLKDIIPGVSPRLIEALEDSGSFVIAEKELRFIEEHNICCLTPEDEEYPKRLNECDDAPLVLFKMGNANLNATKVVSIVGTRKATEYGLQLCNRFVKDLHAACPDILIISGLAYGIDIESHKACLEYNCSTLGVLAHGLDLLYPAAHKQTARNMLRNGGLITEFKSRTIPYQGNFVRRNRIVAGMADAVVVIESASHGGSLITAEMANGYNRDCFAFPGCVGDTFSEGCNALIRDNKAGLICSAKDFLDAMKWSTREKRKNNHNVQMELFSDLTEDENIVLKKIRLRAKGIQINTLIVDCNISYSRISSILFSLEMKGLVKRNPGNIFMPTYLDAR